MSGHGTGSAPLDRETAREVEAPHILTLSTWDGEPYDGEDAHIWDQANITCPHQPATETMPCAAREPCGCPGGLIGIAECGETVRNGGALCSRSMIGVHCYINNEPNRPVARCWTDGWDSDIAERAFDLGLMPGTHLVRPWWDGDRVQLELVKPQAVTR